MIESNPNLVILDVRSQGEYDSGHLQNATLIPVTELASRLGELDRQKDILVYCGSGGRSATASQTLVDNGFPSVYNMLGGITSWKNAGYWTEIVHNGDLIIGGTQTYTIENCTFIQTGNIRVEDQATLIIEDAELNMNLSSHYEFDLKCFDQTRLTISNSKVTSNYDLNIWLSNQSFASINSTKIGKLSSEELYGTYYCHAAVYADGDSVLHISDTQVEVLGGNGGTVVAANLTSFMVFANYTSTVTVEDSSLETAGVWFNSAKVSANALKSGNISHFNTFTSLTVVGGTAGALAVENSEVTHGFQLIFTQQSVGDITNCTLYDLDAFYASNIDVSESTINYRAELYDASNTMVANANVASLWMHSDSVASVTNSTIGSLFAGVGLSTPTGVSTISLSGSTIGTVHAGNAQLYMYGNFTYGSTWEPDSWSQSNVTRNFNVIVTDQTGLAIVDAELRLLDRNNSTLLTEFTDSNGRVDFNLTFTDDNYTDTLRLEGVKGNQSATSNLEFLTGTPINLTLYENITGDVNKDGRVDMKDVGYVAKRFMCLPNDPLWDLNADINSDGKIDMKDTSTVARHFGEHI